MAWQKYKLNLGISRPLADNFSLRTNLSGISCRTLTAILAEEAV